MARSKIIMTFLYLTISAALILCLTLAPGWWGWGEKTAEAEASEPATMVGGTVIKPAQSPVTPPSSATPGSQPRRNPSRTRSSGSSGSGGTSADTPADPEANVQLTSQEFTLRQGDSFNVALDYDRSSSDVWYCEYLSDNKAVNSSGQAVSQDASKPSPDLKIVERRGEMVYPDPVKPDASKYLFMFKAAEAGKVELELVHRNHYYEAPVIKRRHTVRIEVLPASEDDPYPPPPAEIALCYGDTWSIASDLPPLVGGEPEKDLRLADGWDQRVLQLKSCEHVVPPGDKTGRGYYLWTFRGAGPGQTELKLERFAKGDEEEASTVYEGKATVFCPEPKTTEKDLEAVAGEELTIKFAADAGAGFHWELKEPLDERFVKFTGKECLEAPDSPEAPWGWLEVWRFKPVAAGSTDITLVYQPSDLPPIETVVIHLKVSPAK